MHGQVLLNAGGIGLLDSLVRKRTTIFYSEASCDDAFIDTRPVPYFARAYMTIARCKQNLLATLDDQINRLIALSGKWGTGKTQLWQQIRAESSHLSIKKAASVLLFGISAISDLKMKIAQALLPRLH